MKKKSFLGKIGGLSFAFLSLCLLLCRPDVAWSLERILEMDVCAVVERDSSLVVTERIAFVAEWREIRRGLIRNVPVVHREGWRRIRGDFRLMSATLDGAPVPCEVKRAGDDVELHLGDERFLSQGAHEYVLTYSLTRQLIFHDDGVELYWNVTGNEWIFPIERASFRVELPQGASIMEYDAATGAFGSREKSWTLVDGAFRTTRALRPGEGFTVSTVWPAGFVVPPPETSETSSDHFAGTWRQRLLIVMAAVLVLWYAGSWWFYGRDPEKGTVFPLFEPPHGFEPAYIGYVKKLRFDSDLFLADLIDLAVGGFLVLAPGAASLTASRTEKDPDTVASLPQRALLKKLFENGDSVTLGGGNPVIAAFTQKMTAALPAFYREGSPGRPTLMNRNRRYSRGGLLLLVPFLALLCQTSELLFAQIFLVAFVCIWCGLFFGGTGGFFRVLRKSFRTAGGTAAVSARRVVTIIVGVAVVFLLGFIGRVLLPILSTATRTAWREDALVTGSALTALASTVVFFILMPARTPAGRRLLDEVLGFEMYLRTAEKHRLEALYPSLRDDVPELTPELFERLLPYAFALGVAETWVNAFASLLNAGSYQPRWHSGSAFHAASLSRSMSVMSASMRSYGGSGRGGRTSSGGGRGGGGGRGR